MGSRAATLVREATDIVSLIEEVTSASATAKGGKRDRSRSKRDREGG